MRVQDHLKLSSLAAIAALPWLKQEAVIPLVASIGIDIDHYIWHAVTHRTLSVRAAARYFGQADPPQLARQRLLHHPLLLGALLVLALSASYLTSARVMLSSAPCRKIGRS